MRCPVHTPDNHTHRLTVKTKVKVRPLVSTSSEPRLKQAKFHLRSFDLWLTLKMKTRKSRNEGWWWKVMDSLPALCTTHTDVEAGPAPAPWHPAEWCGIPLCTLWICFITTGYERSCFSQWLSKARQEKKKTERKYIREMPCSCQRKKAPATSQNLTSRPQTHGDSQINRIEFI